MEGGRRWNGKRREGKLGKDEVIHVIGWGEEEFKTYAHHNFNNLHKFQTPHTLSTRTYGIFASNWNGAVTLNFSRNSCCFTYEGGE